MSKLFDTLEKIRRQETYHVPKAPGAFPGQEVPGSNRKSRLLVFMFILAAVLIAAFSGVIYRHLQHKTNTENTIKAITASNPAAQPPTTPVATIAPPNQTRMVHDQQTVQPPPAVLQNLTQKATLSAEQITALNNQGVETIRAKQDYWKGIYLLNLAKEKDPNRIEPLINMAVALNELGLTGPANRYLTAAYSINPKHPGLQQNLDILARAGQLDGTIKMLTP